MSKKDFIKASFGRHQEVFIKTLSELLPDIEKGSQMIEEVLRSGHKILSCGNGGSAADAQHFAAEWVGRFKKERESLPAIALTTDSSALTAIANDYGYEKVFSRQISSLGQRGDLLVAISTSGKSPSILDALRIAKERGIKSILLTGPKGDSQSADLVIKIPNEETARIQEMHELILHVWCEIFEA